MLRNMKVGTKILTILVAPLLVLGVLAGLGVQERLAVANSAHDVEQFTEVAAADSDAVHEIQLERILSAEYLGSGGQLGGDDLVRQREATDEAVSRLEPLLSEIDFSAATTGMGEQVAAVQEQLNSLDDLRTSVDGAALSTQAAMDGYARVTDSLLVLNSEISASIAVPELAASFNDYVSLAKAKGASAAVIAGLTAVLASGTYEEGQLDALVTTSAEENSHLTRFFESQNAGYRSRLRSQLDAPEVQQAAALQAEIIAAGALGGSGDSGVLIEDQIAAGTARLNAYLAVEDAILDNVNSEAAAQSFAAEKAVRLYLAGAAAATLVALLLASIVARATTRPLRKLTKAANVLSSERIPRLVEDLRSPESMSDRGAMLVEPIEVRSRDEIGQLAEAFNAIQNVTVEVAEQQAALLRKGIGDIFVNLARRNQSLLDRQIEFIDELEANEEDPEQLEHLFKLDHLATRMRRNAESLLVLAGAEPPRRRARPVALADVVRVAIGEVEDFTRVNLLALDEVTVGGNVAVDLAHLLSELMENATQFSPPETLVEVVGQRTTDAGYLLTVSDQGIGMSAEQLAEANRMLAHPPLVGLALSRSLGFIVIGRLATRFGIGVRLVSSPAGGISAMVSLPAGLVSDGGMPEVDAPVIHDIATAIANGAEVPQDPGTMAPPPPPPSFAPAPEPARPVGAAPSLGALFAEAPVVGADNGQPPMLPNVEPMAGDGGPYGFTPPPPPYQVPPAAQDASSPAAMPAGLTPQPDADFWSPSDQQPTGFPELTDDPGPRFDNGAFGPFGAPPAAEPPADVPLFSPPANGSEPDSQAGSPASLHEALPEGAAFEEGLASLVNAPPPSPTAWPAPELADLAPPPPPPSPPPPPPPPPPPTAPAPAPAPAPVDDLSAPLTRRAAAAPAPPSDPPAPPRGAPPVGPGSGQRLTAAGLVQRSAKPVNPTPPRPAATGRRAVSASQRSPEEVQEMLSRYRSGLQQGRQPGRPTSNDHPEERS